ncbi:MAG: hypothetical protein Q9227_004108 [Pyrenula ochraceoflavens]
MPPENTPSETPPLTREETTLYLRELEQAYISSPVPNLAATLTTQAEEDTHEENLRFLRRQPSRSPDRSLNRRQRAYLTATTNILSEEETQRLDRENRRRLIRSIDMSRRIPVVGQGMRQDESNLHRRSNYANRTPNRQSLYDWAPGSDDEDAQSMLNSLRDLGHLNESRENLPSYAQSRWATWRNGVGADRQDRPNFRNNPQPRDEPSGSITLRSWTDEHTAGEPQDPSLSLHQSLERHRRRAHARSQLTAYVLDRDRFNNQSPAREPTSTRLHRSERSNLYNIPAYRARRNLSEACKKMVENDPSLQKFKNSMIYLSGLRSCESSAEAVELGRQLNHVHELTKAERPAKSPPAHRPTPSSWLTPGAVWQGKQLSSQDSNTAAIIRNQNADLERNYHTVLPGDPRTSQSNSLAPQALDPHDNVGSAVLQDITSLPDRPTYPEHWPVRITLHTVDYSTSTVTGTMEAFNIPDRASPERESSMKSFFEGEIIDFVNYSLQTEGFDAGIEADTLYWRGLGPFRDLCAHAMQYKLCDKKWLRKCGAKRQFLSDSPASCGLTIRGFYYIAMERSTGKIEGLYYDPESQPYQQLILKPADSIENADVVSQKNWEMSNSDEGMQRRKWWPAYEFR